MVTDAQVRRLREKRMVGRRWRLGLSERTARRWQREALPSAAKADRPWRTREGQLADVPRMRRRRRPGVHRPGRSTAPPVGPPTPHLRAGRLATVIRLAKASLRPCAILPSLCVSSGKTGDVSRRRPVAAFRLRALAIRVPAPAAGDRRRPPRRSSRTETVSPATRPAPDGRRRRRTREFRSDSAHPGKRRLLRNRSSEPERDPTAGSARGRRALRVGGATDSRLAVGRTFRWQLFDAGGSRWDERGNRARRLVRELGRDEPPAVPRLDERGEPALVGRRPVGRTGNRARWLERDVGGLLDERGEPRSSARMGNSLAGTSRRRLPAGRTGSRAGGSGRQLGEGSGAAAWRPSPAEPDGGTFLVTFYRELRGMGEKVRISGTLSARHDVAFGQLPTSPWMPGARQMAVFK